MNAREIKANAVVINAMKHPQNINCEGFSGGKTGSGVFMLLCLVKVVETKNFDQYNHTHASRELTQPAAFKLFHDLA
jgi:hypothetical protein